MVVPLALLPVHTCNATAAVNNVHPASHEAHPAYACALHPRTCGRHMVRSALVCRDWTDKFDLVWSQEAFCHCMDHTALMAEIQRVLKPGGTIVFSDIMQSDVGGDCTSFTGQNVTTKLASPQTYKARACVIAISLMYHF